MASIDKNKAEISKSVQAVLNKTMDDKFDVIAVEILGYCSADDSLHRITVTTEGKLKVAL